MPLSEALRSSSSLTKVDLSYNSFGEEAGKLFGEVLSGHSHLLEVNLKWNSLRAKGGAAVAEGMKNNQALRRTLPNMHAYFRSCVLSNLNASSTAACRNTAR